MLETTILWRATWLQRRSRTAHSFSEPELSSPLGIVGLLVKYLFLFLIIITLRLNLSKEYNGQFLGRNEVPRAWIGEVSD